MKSSIFRRGGGGPRDCVHGARGPAGTGQHSTHSPGVVEPRGPALGRRCAGRGGAPIRHRRVCSSRPPRQRGERRPRLHVSIRAASERQGAGPDHRPSGWPEYVDGVGRGTQHDDRAPGADQLSDRRTDLRRAAGAAVDLHDDGSRPRARDRRAVQCNVEGRVLLQAGRVGDVPAVQRGQPTGGRCADDHRSRRHGAVHRAPRDGHARPRHLQRRGAGGSRCGRLTLVVAARVEPEAVLHVQRRRGTRPQAGGARRRVPRPAALARLRGGHHLAQHLRQQLQLRRLGGDRDDAEGAHRRDARRDSLHDLERRIGRRDAAAAPRERLSRTARRHRAERQLPRHLEEFPRDSGLLPDAPLLQGAVTRHMGRHHRPQRGDGQRERDAGDLRGLA